MEGREKQRFEYYESEVWSIFANYLFGSEAAAVDAAMAELGKSWPVSRRNSQYITHVYAPGIERAVSDYRRGPPFFRGTTILLATILYSLHDD